MEAEYFFYSKNDSGKEAISKIKAVDLESAEEAFAEIKKLSIDEFKRIYIVERDNSKSVR